MTAAIEARHLSVERGSRRVLDDVTLSVEAGEFVCICGPNGGGKTTFLKAILGLVAPSQGTLQVFGESPGAVLSRVGYLPQRKGFAPDFPARVVELVVAGRRGSWPIRVGREDRERALRTLRRVGGEAIADRPLSGLSGGETQRAFLARALANDPRLLLLDEPTAGVDALGRAEFLDLLAEIADSPELTAVLVTHNLAAVRRLADRVAYIDGGLKAFGPPDEVLGGPGAEGHAFAGLDHAEHGATPLCEEG